MRKDFHYFINQYLKNRPLFLSLIRPQEADLFYNHKNYLKHPVLDFGCGDGFFVKAVFGKKVIDVGLDVKTSRIKEAERNRIYKKTVVCDGKRIPFSDNYFKTAISNSVLEHLPHLEASLKEIRRVLTPKGYLITTVMADRWEDCLFGAKILDDSYKKYMRKIQAHYNLLSKGGWQKNLKKQDLILKELSVVSHQKQLLS